MLVEQPVPKVRVVDDYDFTFNNGIFWQISLDKSIGDSVDFDTHPTAIRIQRVSKPSNSDPSVMLPADDITIFVSHILIINHRIREAQEVTAAQKDEWKKTIQEMTGSIN